MDLILCIASILLCTICVHAQPNYNLSLTDQSPAITYQPSRSGPSSQTWNVTYTNSSWSTYAPETIGEGTSSHYTTRIGSSASIAFNGSGLYIYGNASEADYQITLEGKVQYDLNPNPTVGLLGSLTGLKGVGHTASLEVIGDGGTSLTGFTVELNLGGDGATIHEDTQLAIQANGNQNSGFVTTGTWESATLIGGGDGSLQETYDRIDTHTTGSTLTLSPPQGTLLVAVYGSVNYDHSSFSVYTTSGSTNTTKNYSGLSPWISTDQVIYFTTLDANHQGTVEFTFLGNDSQYLDIAQAVYLSATGGGGGLPSGSTPSAAIAGGVVGGVVGIVIVGFIIWYWRRRKHDRQIPSPTAVEAPSDHKPFEIEPYEEMDVQETNYADPQTAYANAALGRVESLQPSHPYAHRITPLIITNQDESLPSRYSPSRSAATTITRPEYYPPGNEFQRSLANEQSPPPQGGIDRQNSLMRAAERKARLYESEEAVEGSSDMAYRSEGAEQEVIQEQDAGRMTIPPTYDPTWAESRESTTDIRSDGGKSNGTFGASGGRNT